MNYLELVNDFLIETDYSDQVISVLGLQDDELRAASWVRDSWIHIQRQERWSFMAREGTLTTVDGKSDYTLDDITYPSGSDTANRVSNQHVRNETSERYLRQVGRLSLRWQKETGSVSSFAINPDRSIVLGPIPLGVQVLKMDTWTNPVELALNTDVPSLPPQYHKAIVWLAISNYAREQGGEWNGLRQAAHQEYNQMYANLSNDYLPIMEPKRGLV